ncbi:HeH/LEM domain-containing protein [Jeotgalicoccus huakuii]|nr:HeH/LEM domain-containing protein [Jeotgalicoccus huakuii]
MAQASAPDYSEYTVAELKEMLDERGIEYSSSDLKADLIALLEG